MCSCVVASSEGRVLVRSGEAVCMARLVASLGQWVPESAPESVVKLKIGPYLAVACRAGRLWCILVSSEAEEVELALCVKEIAFNCKRALEGGDAAEDEARLVGFREKCVERVLRRRHAALDCIKELDRTFEEKSEVVFRGDRPSQYCSPTVTAACEALLKHMTKTTELAKSFAILAPCDNDLVDVFVLTSLPMLDCCVLTPAGLSAPAKAQDHARKALAQVKETWRALTSWTTGNITTTRRTTLIEGGPTTPISSII